MSAVAIRAEVAASGRGQARIVGAVKNRSDDEARALLAAGITDLGENRLQEHRRRQGPFPGVRWHYIGRLQTNKARGIAREFSLVHSVSRLEEAVGLAAPGGRGAEALVQVNFGDRGKGGVPPDEVAPLLAAIAEAAPGLTIRGLMTMAPLTTTPESSRAWFRELRLLGESLFPAAILSMGTSQDWRVALEEGASLVRLGRSLFA
ncbi:YggS family pyridoxal phosphate enzyme [bacterium]|nr:YggS family pyridoxal phosphate enzyme [bacterium]